MNRHEFLLETLKDVSKKNWSMLLGNSVSRSHNGMNLLFYIDRNDMVIISIELLDTVCFEGLVNTAMIAIKNGLSIKG